ncbi:hypothetical protein ACFQ41_10310 [Lacticaseibacillus suilingensis]|uniref:EpsG family protein n=1 Tax=Lacticaseibacillus suilingensis TaxID=2799577 RepID=A0ABW4BHJ4_9LACO|nr:hypothetical protein [Lacticaseibacillus suilingensis]
MLTIFTLILVAVSPLAGLYPAGKQLLFGKRKFIDILPMALILSLLGLFYVPIVQVDLTRYFSQLDVVRNMTSFPQFLQSLDLSQQVQISQQVFFYLMSRLSWNNLLPFTVVLIVSCIGFYIIKDFGSNLRLNNSFMALCYIAFALMMPWGQVITNIRYISSVSIFMFAIYRDLYQGKKGAVTWLLYFVACTMHIATFVLLGVRLGLLFIQLLKSEISQTKRICIYVGLLIVLVFFMQTSIFKMVLSKGLVYLNGGGEGSGVQQWFAQADSSLGRSLGKHIEMFFLLTQVVIMGIGLTKAARSRTAINSSLVGMYSFTMIMMVITLFWTLLAGTTWIRFAFLVDFCAIFIIYAEENYLTDRYLVLVNQTLWIGMFIWSVIWQVYQYVGSEMMTRGDYYNILFPFRWLIQ